MEKIKVGCIGTGVMGSALMKAVAKTVNHSNIFVCDVAVEKAKQFAHELSINFVESNTEVVKNCDVIFLAVKPVYVKDVLEKLDLSGKLLVSMAAGVSTETLSLYIGSDKKIVRIMPNIPATVGEAMIAVTANKNVSSDEKKLVCELLSKAGSVELVAENLMDTVTGISGSGPAYGFVFIEALADAAVKLGMPRKQAYIYAAQTLKGAAAMVLETGIHPAELKDNVCSPGGTTIDGVQALEDHGFRSAVIAAAIAAYEKSVQLGKK